MPLPPCTVFKSPGVVAFLDTTTATPTTAIAHRIISAALFTCARSEIAGRVLTLRTFVSFPPADNRAYRHFSRHSRARSLTASSSPEYTGAGRGTRGLAARLTGIVIVKTPLLSRLAEHFDSSSTGYGREMSRYLRLETKESKAINTNKTWR